MNSPALGLRVASVLSGLIGLAHLLRLILGFKMYCGSHYFQQRYSLLTLILCAALCVWFWLLACKAAKAQTPPPAAT